MGNGRIFVDSLWFAVGTFCFQGARFGAQIVAARQLGPELFGVWQGLLLLVSYGVCSHLGVLNAMNRDIPYFEGMGKPGEIVWIRDVSLGVAERSALMLALLIVFCSYFFSAHTTRIGLRYVAIMTLLSQLYLFYQMLLKSHRLFRFMSIQQIVFAMLTLLWVLPLTYYFQFQGFLGGQILVMATVLLFIKSKLPFKITPRIDWKKTVVLVRRGFPIMMVGMVFSLFTTVDRLVILKYLGKKALGYYSLSIMATGILMYIPAVIAQIVYPQMSRRYGETGRYLSLTGLIYKPSLYLLAILLPVLAGVFFLFPVFIQYFIPQYIPGIPSLKITVFGIFFLSLSGLYANFLNTVGLQNWYLLLQVVAIAVVVVLDLISIRLNFGIEGIAMATTFSYMLYTASLIGVAMLRLRKESSD